MRTTSSPSSQTGRNNTSKELLEKWRQGDLEGLNQLIEILMGDLRKDAEKLLYKFPKHKISKDSLINRAFLSMYRRAHVPIENRDHFRFLYRISMYRKLLNHNAKERKYEVKKISMDDDDIFLDLPDLSEKDAEIWVQYQDLLEHLKEEQPHLVEPVLLWTMGFTQEQVGEKLGISRRVARDRIKQGLICLKRMVRISNLAGPSI